MSHNQVVYCWRHLTGLCLSHLWQIKVSWMPDLNLGRKGVTTLRTLCQIGFTSGNYSWQIVTKYWAAVSADFHAAPPRHGSCCQRTIPLKVTPQTAQVVAEVPQRFLGRKMNTTRPRLHMLALCLWQQNFHDVGSLPMHPVPSVLQKTLPPVPSPTLWGEEPGPGVLSNTGGCYGSSPVPFGGCHRILWDVPRSWGYLMTSGWRAGQGQWRNATDVALYLCNFF